MKISMIVATDMNLVIGRDGKLPWRLPADLAWFKNCTLGKPVIMGRKTYESIGRPLPGRFNIVVSRDKDLFIEGVVTASSVEDAIAACGDVDEIMVIGGGEIYKAFMDRVDRVYLTTVATVIKGDTYFPLIKAEGTVVEFQVRLADEKNKYPMTFSVIDLTRE